MRLMLLFILFLSSATVSAQDIEVRKLVLMDKDQTAVSSPRKDLNGTACALVRVALKEPGAEFEGNVMGDVQFTGSEYLVYLTDGSKRIGIKHPDFLPTTVVFADYGTKKVASSTTYQLNVKTNKKKAKVDNSKKGIAVFNIKPSNAMLLIDGQVADGASGVYNLSLPFGTHYYTVKMKDFSLNNQVVKIDKTAKTIDVDLTEYFAKVTISCPTEDAELTINGEQKGIGQWNGMLAPGSYTIEALKDGCHSQSRQIVLKDNDEQTVAFTKLKSITGSLRVDYEPAGADVLLNGKKVGVTPLTLDEIPVGDYHIEVYKEYYVKAFVIAKIMEDQVWKESGKLTPTWFGRLIIPVVYGIDRSEMWSDVFRYDCSPDFPEMALAHYYRFGTARGYHPDDCYACVQDSSIVPFDPVKAISWYKKVYQDAGADEWDKNEAWEALSYPSEGEDEASIAFGWAKGKAEQIENCEDCNGCDNANRYYRNDCPYAALAWHYFYGVGCQKNVSKAKQYMRLLCPDGTYHFPAFIQLIKDMGLDTELTYKP